MRSRFGDDRPDPWVAPVGLAAIPAGAALGWYADLRTALLLLAAMCCLAAAIAVAAAFVPHITDDANDVQPNRRAARLPQTAGSHA